MGTPQREVEDMPLGAANRRELLQRIEVTQMVLNHGRKRAYDGCVASESLAVFTQAIHNLDEMRNALLR